jgi:hypothetical protein
MTKKFNLLVSCCNQTDQDLNSVVEIYLFFTLCVLSRQNNIYGIK